MNAAQKTSQKRKNQVFVQKKSVLVLLSLKLRFLRFNFYEKFDKEMFR